MTFKEMALTRQSCRDYSDKEVDLEILKDICKISLNAPSACNSQPWLLHIIHKDSKNLDDVRKACQVVGLNKFLNKVNNFIVIEQVAGNSSSKAGSLFSQNDLNSMDTGILAAHICFAALDYNLGTCMIGAFRKDVILKAMNFKKNQTVRMVIAIGYPSENDKIRKKVRKDPNNSIIIK